MKAIFSTIRSQAIRERAEPIKLLAEPAKCITLWSARFQSSHVFLTFPRARHAHCPANRARSLHTLPLAHPAPLQRGSRVTVRQTCHSLHMRHLSERVPASDSAPTISSTPRATRGGSLLSSNLIATRV